MKLSKYHRPIPNKKIFHEPANSPITTYRWTPEQISEHLKGMRT